MGSDIHMIVERRVEGEWIAWNTMQDHHAAGPGPEPGPHSSSVALARNYPRFARLAGVRGEGPVPLGVPADASKTARAKIADWGRDGHHHSWLPLHDAAALFLETEPLPFAQDSHPAQYPLDYYFDATEAETEPADWRLIFWFDN